MVSPGTAAAVKCVRLQGRELQGTREVTCTGTRGINFIYTHIYIYENELETVVVTEREEAELEVEVEDVKLGQQSYSSG